MSEPVKRYAVWKGELLEEESGADVYGEANGLTVVLATDYDAAIARAEAAEKRVVELEARLTVEVANSKRGWELFEQFRKKYAEIRFPGLVNQIYLAETEVAALAAFDAALAAGGGK